MTAVEVAPVANEADSTVNEIDHIYCEVCDPSGSTSLCGLDISSVPEVEVLSLPCVVCDELCDLPCERCGS